MSRPRPAAQPGGLSLPGVVTLALVWLVLPHSPAAEKDPFQVLRESYHRGLAEATLEKEFDYAAQLPGLEERFRQRKDYLSARAVAAEIEATRSRIAALEKFSRAETGSPGQAGSEPSTGIEGGGLHFDAETAVLDGNVRFDVDRTVVTDFRTSGDQAHWNLPGGLAEGGYEVILHYSCKNKAGGSIRVEAGFFYLPGQIEPTGRSPEIQSKHLGTLRLTAGTSTLRIVAETVSNESLMQLRSLELRPSSLQP